MNIGTMSVPIQPPVQQRFSLQPWISKPAQRIPRQKKFVSNLSQIEQLAPYLSKLAKYHSVKIFSASTTLAVPPTPFNEYPKGFPTEKNDTLPPLRPEMNHSINLKDPNVVVKLRPIKPKQKFLDQLHAKLRQEEASGRVYKSSDTSACTRFMTPKIDMSNKERILHDLVARNSNTIMEPPNIPHQSSIINTIARYPFRSKIDLSDGYHNIRIHSPMRSTQHLSPHVAPTEPESRNRVTGMPQLPFRRS